MAVRAQCPRCKQPLSVPNKLAGSYANCPRCQGRFWISKDAPIDSSNNDSVGMSAVSTLTLTQAPVATPPVATPPGPPVSPAAPVQVAPPPRDPTAAVAAKAPVAPPPARQYFPSVTPVAPSSRSTPAAAPVAGPTDTVLTAPPAAPPQARKVARLVTAEAAESALKVAADGQLPLLQLQEDDKNQKTQNKTRSIPPAVMILVWIVSVSMAVAIVMIKNQDTSGVATEAKRNAMAKIEEQFFGDPARGELLPYQRDLREARQARARGDLKAEREFYKRVLDLLHTETRDESSPDNVRNRLEKGVTGSHSNDQDLEKYILTILDAD